MSIKPRVESLPMIWLVYRVFFSTCLFQISSFLYTLMMSATDALRVPISVYQCLGQRANVISFIVYLIFMREGDGEEKGPTQSFKLVIIRNISALGVGQKRLS